jgi:hypothetical protein
MCDLPPPAPHPQHIFPDPFTVIRSAGSLLSPLEGLFAADLCIMVLTRLVYHLKTQTEA